MRLFGGGKDSVSLRRRCSNESVGAGAEGARECGGKNSVSLSRRSKRVWREEQCEFERECGGKSRVSVIHTHS